MLRSTSYTSIQSSYELEEKKGPSVTVRDIDLNDNEHRVANQEPPHSTPIVEPGTLTQGSWFEAFYNAYDTFLCLLAVTLLLKTSLVILAWRKDYDNRGSLLDRVSSMTTSLTAFNDQVVTGFTIVFVTIVTTLTRRYALYKAQEGACISDLEQLQASMSLPSTIKAVFSLRRFTKRSVVLVVLWSFYYLGSQASKREYALTSSGPFETLPAVLATSNITTILEQPQTVSNLGVASMTGANANLISAMAYSAGFIRNGDSDMFGNLLLPDPGEIGALQPNGSKWLNHTHGIPIRTSQTIYTSFAGRALLTRSSGPDRYWMANRLVGSYAIRTSYFKVNCIDVTLTAVDQFPTGVIDSMNVSLNMTNSTTVSQLNIWQRWRNMTRDDGSTLTVNGSTDGAIKMTCDVVEPVVEISLHCDSSCRTWQVYCPDIPSEQLYSTRFQKSMEWAHGFFSHMLLSEGTPVSRDHTTMVQEAFGLDFLLQKSALKTIDSESAAPYLSLWSSVCTGYINTYFNLLIQYPLENGSIVPKDGFFTSSFSSSAALYDPRYQIHWEWIAIDYIAGLILLVAAILSFWVRKHTLAPDVFGYVSTLTRDNPHFPVPPGGSTLDGIERTRRLGNLKVKIGDVADGRDGVGKIAFVPVHPTFERERLSRSKRYV